MCAFAALHTNNLIHTGRDLRFEYKAEDHSVETVQGDPLSTSKRCLTCGVTRDDNRSGESFECQTWNILDLSVSPSVGVDWIDEIKPDGIDDTAVRDP